MSSPYLTFAGTVPANYEQYMGPIFFDPYAADLVSRIDTGNVGSVLEIACGTGRVTRQLRKALPTSVSITATDLQPGMIEVAKQLMPGNDVAFQVADAQELPFPDDSFDVVVCQFGFMFVPDKAKAFREARRVLKSSGRLLFNTWDSIEHNPLSHTVSELLKTKMPGTSAAQFYTIPFSMHDKEAITQLLKEAGFSNIKIEVVTKEGVAESALNAAKALILGTPVFNAIIAIDPSAPGRLVSQAEKKIADCYGDIPCKSEMRAVVVEGEGCPSTSSG